METKDIPEIPILQFLHGLRGQIAIRHGIESMPGQDIHGAFPAETPEKIITSKLKTLKRKGYIDGCPCGCSGQFTLTKMGAKLLMSDA